MSRISTSSCDFYNEASRVVVLLGPCNQRNALNDALSKALRPRDLWNIYLHNSVNRFRLRNIVSRLKSPMERFDGATPGIHPAKIAKACAEMTELHYFFSVLSPFTYLAGDGLEQLAKKHGVTIRYKPIDIIDLFGRTGGVAPKDRHPSRKAYRLQELARISKLNGLDINLAPAHWPTNPLPASCAIIAAEGNDSGDRGALVRALLRSCWLEEKDIGRAEVVADCLERAGYPRMIADSLDPNSETAFKENTNEAVSRNVFGSPTYVAGDQVFWGQDRLPHLDAWLGGELE